MFRKKTFWIVMVVLALLGGGGYVAYANGLLPWFAPQEPVVEEPVLQTAAVSVGDLSITADGTGVLVPSSEVELAFGWSDKARVVCQIIAGQSKEQFITQ